MMRSRWAAIGAAVAVTLGAGGLISVRAESPPSSLVAITPTRVLDTRFDIGLTGAFQHRVSRDLDVTGTIATVGPGNTMKMATVVPDGATAIVANVTAVNPTTAGFVAVRPGSATGDPSTSNLNFTSGGVVVPNSVTVELPTNGAAAGLIDLFFSGTGSGATTHLLIDLVGYYVKGAGLPGPPGPAGLAGVTYLTAPFSITDGDFGQVVTPACPAGEFAISGGLDPNWPPAVQFDPGPDVFIYTTYPDSGLSFRRWVIEYSNATGEDADTTLYTVCAEVAD